MIKTVWYGHKNRHIDHWSRIESTEINPCLYGQLILAKEARAYNGVKTVSSMNSTGRTRLVHAKKIKLDHHLTPHTRINSKWLKDADISCDTTKIPEENLGSKI